MERDEGVAIFLDALSLGVTKTLEKRKGICDIKVVDCAPVDKTAITSWEQRYACMLPDDLRKFYQTTNGFLLTWNFKMNDTRIPVGRMEINSLERLVRLAGLQPSRVGNPDQKKPTLLDVEDSDDDEDGLSHPKFDHRSRIFELDACEGFGKVCFVYTNTKPGIPAQHAEVWFLDRALQWHFLADSFLNYYRLMVTYLGLPQWQYVVTNIGVSPQAKQWFNMFCPVRIDDDPAMNIVDGAAVGAGSNQVDAARLFLIKSDKKKSLPNAKNVPKRQGVSSARATGAASQGRGGSANQQNRTVK